MPWLRKALKLANSEEGWLAFALNRPPKSIPSRMRKLFMKARPIRIDGDLAYVPLTRGHVAVLDVSDLPFVVGKNWYALVVKDTAYACRNVLLETGYRVFLMHRVIMGEPVGMVIDHIDGNGLNNTRSNLRPATHAQNLQNQGLARHNTSGFKGVYFDSQRNKWKADIYQDRKRYRLGRFNTPEEAHAAYCRASQRLHGEFSRTS